MVRWCPLTLMVGQLMDLKEEIPSRSVTKILIIVLLYSKQSLKQLLKLKSTRMKKRSLNSPILLIFKCLPFTMLLTTS